MSETAPAGRSASVLEAERIIRAVRDRGEHPDVNVTGEHWLWTAPLPNGRGPALSFCEAAYGVTPRGTHWVCTCEAEHDGCVRPSHYTLIRDGEPEPVHPSIRTEFARRISQEASARRDPRAFARELGVAQSTLRAWQAGEQHPGRDVEARLAARFGWDGRPRKWIVTVLYQSVEMTDSAGAAAEQALRPLQRDDGMPVKAVVHSVSRVA
jgi:hypothetical protein